MARFSFLLLLLNFVLGACSSSPIGSISKKAHPRILLLKGEERQIAQSISQSPEWGKMHEAILTECDRIIELPTLERVKHLWF